MGIIPTARIPVALAVVAAEAVEVSNVFSAPAATPCVKFYHPERRSGQLMQLCRNQECTCAEGKKTPSKKPFGWDAAASWVRPHPSALCCPPPENCSMQKKGSIDNSLRSAKLCETTPLSKIDYGGWLAARRIIVRGPAGGRAAVRQRPLLCVCPQCTK